MTMNTYRPMPNGLTPDLSMDDAGLSEQEHLKLSERWLGHLIVLELSGRAADDDRRHLADIRAFATEIADEAEPVLTDRFVAEANRINASIAHIGSLHTARSLVDVLGPGGVRMNLIVHRIVAIEEGATT